jgi:hypothetical protein
MIDLFKSFDINKLTAFCNIEVILDKPFPDDTHYQSIVKNFPLDVYLKSEKGIPKLYNTKGHIIGASMSPLNNLSMYKNINMNGFSKISYNYKDDHIEKPQTFIPNGTYCQTCQHLSPNVHAEDCSRFELYYTQEGLFNYHNKLGEYFTKMSNNSIVIKEQWLDGPVRTRVLFDDGTKRHINDAYIVEYYDNGLCATIKLWNTVEKSDPIKFSIASNKWSKLGLHEEFVDRLNSVFDNNFRVSRIKISSFFVNLMIIDTYNIKLDHFHDFMGANEYSSPDISITTDYESKYITYKSPGSKYKHKYQINSLQKGTRNMIILIDTESAYKYTIQVFSTNSQIMMSYDKEIEDPIFYDSDDIDSLKNTLVTRMRNVCEILNIIINSYVTRYTSNLKRDIAPERIYTRYGKVPYVKHKIYNANDLNLSIRKNPSILLYDVTSRKWTGPHRVDVPKSTKYIKNLKKKEVPLYIYIFNKDHNEEPEEVNVYLIKQAKEGTPNTVCRDTVSSTDRKTREDSVNSRPDPYSFTGECTLPVLHYMDYDGTQSSFDNNYYPCCVTINNMDTSRDALIQFLLDGNGTTPLEKYMYMLPDTQFEPDSFSGTFKNRFIRVGSVITVLRDNEWINARIDNFSDVKGSDNDPKYIEVDMSDIEKDEKFRITYDSFHPKYCDQRKFDGLNNLFNNSEQINSFLKKNYNELGTEPYEVPIGTSVTGPLLETLYKRFFKVLRHLYLNKITINNLAKTSYIAYIIPRGSVHSIVHIENKTLYIISRNCVASTTINYDSVLTMKCHYDSEHIYICNTVSSNIIEDLNNSLNRELFKIPDSNVSKNLHIPIFLINCFQDENQYDIYFESQDPKDIDMVWTRLLGFLPLQLQDIKTKYDSNIKKTVIDYSVQDITNYTTDTNELSERYGITAYYSVPGLNKILNLDDALTRLSSFNKVEQLNILEQTINSDILQKGKIYNVRLIASRGTIMYVLAPELIDHKVFVDPFYVDTVIETIKYPIKSSFFIRKTWAFNIIDYVHKTFTSHIYEPSKSIRDPLKYTKKNGTINKTNNTVKKLELDSIST